MTNNKDNYKEFMEDFIRAQSEMAAIKFDSKNPFHGNKYASLSAILKAVKPALHCNDFALIQKVVTHDEGLVLETILMHATGESITSQTPLIANLNTMQALGGAVTYARRYAIVSLMGAEAEKDDDGQNVSMSHAKSKSVKNNEPPPESDSKEKNWERDKGWFMNKIKPYGTYDEISEHTQREGWGKPSTWNNKSRNAFIEKLEKGEIIIGGNS